MPKSRRESVDVTALLRNILDNYPAGSATIREFLQNTDDCGASQQVRCALATRLREAKHIRLADFHSRYPSVAIYVPCGCKSSKLPRSRNHRDQ